MKIPAGGPRRKDTAREKGSRRYIRRGMIDTREWRLDVVGGGRKEGEFVF